MLARTDSQAVSSRRLVGHSIANSLIRSAGKYAGHRGRRRRRRLWRTCWRYTFNLSTLLLSGRNEANAILIRSFAFRRKALQRTACVHLSLAGEFPSTSTAAARSDPIRRALPTLGNAWQTFQGSVPSVFEIRSNFNTSASSGGILVFSEVRVAPNCQ